MARSLSERLAAGKPEVFKFEAEGDAIVGEVDAIEVMSGDYGSYHVLTLLASEVNGEPSDGEAFSVAMFGGVLKSQFEAKRPAVGMTIAISYQGTKPSKVKGHQAYKDYLFLVDETTRPVGSVTVPTALESLPAPDAEDFGEEPF